MSALCSLRGDASSSASFTRAIRPSSAAPLSGDAPARGDATRDATRKLSWQNSETLGADAVGALKKLKQSDGPNLLTQGSSDFLKTLLAAGLVDELNLFIAPLILGKGKRLFADSGKPGNLKLVSSQVMPSGIIHAKYVPDGEVKTGSFEFETPTEAELERRKNLT